MRFPWWKGAKAIESRRVVSSKTEELETAKEILAEVFQVRLWEVEQMLLKRLEEQSDHQEYQEGQWPATFCLGE